MASNAMNRVIEHLRCATLRQDGAGLADAELLERYVCQRDEAAFEALVRRHGPMVLGVCQRVLRNQADAEDAFQATFLVLVRKAASLRSPGTVSNWLYGVAYNTALKAKAMNRKRRTKEREAGTMPKPHTAAEISRELQALLDSELSRLPDKYRVAIVLCELEGKTIKEAGRRLGWPQGTVATRLARGRALLAKRLAKYGLTLPAGVLAAMLSQGTAAGVPPALVLSTVKAASLMAAGTAAATGVISAKVAALTEGVLKSMLLSKLKVAVVVLLGIGALGIGASGLPHRTVAAEPQSPAAKSAAPRQDKGNLRETVLALEMRLWEAHAKQDLDAFQNLLADDFVGLDAYGNPYTKAGALGFVSRFRLLDASMSDVHVILLNATSAIVTYESRCQVRTTDGKPVESRADRVATAWAQRKGKWWAVFSENTAIGKEEGSLRFDLKDREPVIVFSEMLKEGNREKAPPKD